MAKEPKNPPPADDEYPAEQGTIGSIPNEPTNGFPSHDEVRMAVNEMVAFNERRRKLNAEISAFRKGLKQKGVTLGVLDEQVRLLEWTPEEVKKFYAERDWYAEAQRHPIGAQLELYGTDATPDPVREQLKWRNIGFKDGVAGRGWANEAPKECPTDCIQSYGEGHEEGQATVRRAFATRMEKAKATAAAAGEPDDDQLDIEDVANDAAPVDQPEAA
ncbi:hypothetical protein [Brevundimonas viscosa]|uniref:Uncharacterized protein n=1 Tax=Brevundimonas viscosa TaxID=871741 RepID=A0A1I6PQZ5_9CAUL|nr:hypothetical protein [Brevundimonas viscosa]SFS42627.1 hypothetical protein SAMN05192570_1200 [Brevundimonas viscosa]